MSFSFDPGALFRRDLQDLVPYEVQGTADFTVKLDANESPFGLPAAVREEICRELTVRSFNRYPDPLARELVADLSRHTGVPAEGILAGNGSDELILTLLLAFGTGGKAVITPPTFPMYEVHARIAGAKPVAVPRQGESFALDVDGVIAAAGQPETRLVFICSPNNPTGNATSLAELEAVLKSCRALVVVDEAYQEFGGETALPLLGRYPNLVVLRTFSKAFGLAGLRVGYLLARPEVVRQLKRVKQPYNLNAFSQLAARAALKHWEEYRRLIAAIKEEREELYRELCLLPGVKAHPSEANFILFRTPLPAEEVHRHLLANGILIRRLGGPGLEGYLRVTVGKRDENRLFLEKLREALQTGGCAR
ncbi:histidinol-phosphate transaminase [Desulfovirgula thermocuniculi]|uniref:histidinol-phosphate transaminase n=1 Tax=Desulfovirgula thermocuniculi TaxID=348842 RepID=UPI0004182571|nr:histidinol-phosphate transaminase [Desulfovirgula thermocuniculi]